MRTFAQNQPQQPVSSSFARPNTTTPGCVHHEHPVLYVQRAMGNQAVQRMLQTHVEEPTSGLTGTASPCFGHDFSRISIHPHAVGAIQTKLQISKPGDEYEQEADRTSEQVMRMPEPQLQRACDCGGTCPQCQAEGHKLLQTKHVETGDLGQTAAPPILHDVLRSPGQSLDPATRNFMESRFRYDFSSVRVHSDEMAAESARALHALGYTVGRDIVFGPGQYAPETPTGRQLLAHELTHVVQQEALPSLAATVQRQTDPMQQHMDDMDMEMERKYANSGAPKAQSCGRPSWCPAGFCSPYTSEKLAEYYRSKRAWWLLAGISAVVDDYVAQIVAHQPHGPYHLLGWSFGTELVLKYGALPPVAAAVEGAVLLSPPLHRAVDVDLDAWASYGKPLTVLVPEFDDYLQPPAAAERFARVPQAKLVAVDGAKHLWVGEKYASRALDEIASTVLGGAVALPAQWHGPVGTLPA